MVVKALVNPVTGLCAGLLLGLLSHQAAAMDEIVVSGAVAAARVRASEALFHSQMRAYIRTLSSNLKAALEKDLKKQPRPILQLAASELPTRG